jgi:hypothetical protein
MSLTYASGHLMRPTADYNNSAGTMLVHYKRGRCTREPTATASIKIDIPRIMWILCILAKVLDLELLTTGIFSTI